MIFKGSPRGRASNLALHLMNDQDNEHITLHEVDGFVADDLMGAFREAEAIASATKCKKFFFSLSINPPQNEYASIDDLEQAANRAGEVLGLSGQPRAMVIHEKNGRRHAHVAWSRISASELKAVPMSFFKKKLNTLSKELYLDHGWELPRGHRENDWKNPLNFTLAEWQQAKRIGLDPREIKQIFQEAWKQSDGAKAFRSALEQSGYFLAKGDRRGFVAVDLKGEVYSVARWCGIKTKDVNTRLGDPEKLPSVDETKTRNKSRLSSRMRDLAQESHQSQKQDVIPLMSKRAHMIHAHRLERIELSEKQEIRRNTEQKERSSRLRTGLAGIWDYLTGKALDIKDRNEREAYRGYKRDKRQREMLFIEQLKERKALQKQLKSVRDRHKQERHTLTRHLMEISDRAQSVRQRRSVDRTRKLPKLER